LVANPRTKSALKGKFQTGVLSNETEEREGGATQEAQLGKTPLDGKKKGLQRSKNPLNKKKGGERAGGGGGGDT